MTTANLERLVSQLKELSLEELLTLQERIIGEMRSKTHPETVSQTADAYNRSLSEKLKMLNMDHWPSNATYRREELYDDRGL